MRRWSEEWKTTSGDWNEMKRNTRQQQSKWKAMKICAPIKELQYWTRREKKSRRDEFLVWTVCAASFFFHSFNEVERREWWRAQEELWERYFNSRQWISRREQHLTVLREREKTFVFFSTVVHYSTLGFVSTGSTRVKGRKKDIETKNNESWFFCVHLKKAASLIFIIISPRVDRNTRQWREGICFSQSDNDPGTMSQGDSTVLEWRTKQQHRGE